MSTQGKIKRMFFVIPILAGLLLLSACATDSSAQAAPMATQKSSSATSSGSSSASKVSFANDVMPILKASCNKCHGVEKTEKGLDMTSYSALMTGSERGAVVVPGDANNSSFIHLLLNGKMPKRGQKLSASQIQSLTDWVNAGAPNN